MGVIEAFSHGISSFIVLPALAIFCLIILHACWKLIIKNMALVGGPLAGGGPGRSSGSPMRKSRPAARCNSFKLRPNNISVFAFTLNGHNTTHVEQ